MNAWFLPGVGTATADVAVADTGLFVPRLAPSQVARVWERIEREAEVWRRVPPAERAVQLAALASALRRLGPGDASAPLQRSAGLSQPGLHAAWSATFEPWEDADAVVALWQSEGMADVLPERLPRRIVHVLAGNVLAPGFSMLARGLLLGAAQWIRPAAREPLFAAVLAARIAALAPSLADLVAVLWWPHGDPVEPRVLERAQVVTAQGDDAAIEAIAARVRAASPRARFVGYGTRWSLAVLSSAALTPDNAERLAWDIGLFDQQGCLSPSLVLVEDTGDVESFCTRLAGALATLERRLPRGPVGDRTAAGLRMWREGARLGVALGDVRRLWESPGTEWAVALCSERDWLGSPLDRHVPVVAFSDVPQIERALAERIDRLQGAAVDLAGWDGDRRSRLLGFLRPSWTTRPGDLQLPPPGWAQDHVPPLRGLLQDGDHRDLGRG